MVIKRDQPCCAGALATHCYCATAVWYCVVVFHITLIALSPASGTLLNLMRVVFRDERIIPLGIFNVNTFGYK